MSKLVLFVILAIGGFCLSFKTERKPVIYMIGDSTMANKSLAKGNPERGWGQMLPGYFTTDIVVDNHAKNGRSTKSFREEGLWEKVITQVKEGDYVFIQFGHNDEKINKPKVYSDPKTDFRENLRRYIRETRAKGGIPVLFTSIARRHFQGDTLLDTHGEWIKATRAVAVEEKVVLIDMNRSTTAWLKAAGDEASRKWFMWVEPGTVAACPNGKKDNTHLNVAGGRQVARLAIDEIKEKIPALAPYVRYYDLVVAKDGSGDCFTVQEAINRLPLFHNRKTLIYIRSGVYEEHLVLPAEKNQVKFIFADRKKTVLGSQRTNRIKKHAGKKNIPSEI